MKVTRCELELTHPDYWCLGTPVGERLEEIETLILTETDATTVICTVQAHDDIPTPAAKDQIRRSRGDLNYVCLGTTDDFVWIRPQFDDHLPAHMIIDRARFETWELLR